DPDALARYGDPSRGVPAGGALCRHHGGGVARGTVEREAFRGLLAWPVRSSGRRPVGNADRRQGPDRGVRGNRGGARAGAPGGPCALPAPEKGSPAVGALVVL